jgi:L-aspartate oxidase
MKTDVLIIGSGIGGMSLAIKLASSSPQLKIILMTKKTMLDSNTSLAQGGIAVPLDTSSDSVDRHVADTLLAGDGLCEKPVVEMVINEAAERFGDLKDWGIDFDRDSSGNVSLHREGGHTANRIVHAKDATGRHVVEGLLKKLKTFRNVTFLCDFFALDLVNKRDYDSGKVACGGVVALDHATGAVKTVTSKVTVLATGGIGQMYSTTTNPLIATGDGIAMASRAGAEIRDMEFIQFHPTAFYQEGENPSFLISEAVRGMGGYLRTGDGDRFVFKYDNRGELASRDVVSKAIHLELQKAHASSVYLDCTHLPKNTLKEQFPFIYAACLKKGVDMMTDPVPVAPAAHYLCGGIVTDLAGRTTVDRLYACGECARTGLHGANRLASNSLLEALVFAHRIFLDIHGCINEIPAPNKIVYKHQPVKITPNAKWVKNKRRELQFLMARNVGIVRNTKTLEETFKTLRLLAVQLEELYSVSHLNSTIAELRNMVHVAQLVVRQSLQRKQNRGAFYNIDLIS